MTLVHWDPFRELEEAMLFDWSPTVDVIETPEEFQIKAELPAVKKEDVMVSVDHRILRLEGERRHETEGVGENYSHIERSYGAFLRAFELPANVDDTHVWAEFEDGVLNVRLPKTATHKESPCQSISGS
jgi:HSP20 family protein